MAAIVSVIIISITVYFMFVIIVNDLATGHIKKFFAHYRAVVRKHGFSLERVPGSHDEAPCEVSYRIFNEEIVITRSSRKMLVLLRNIKSNKITHHDLLMMNDCPYSKLPK